jgi:RNA polymerase sigma factor (sigma-70 family)
VFVCDCPPDDCAARVRQYLAGDAAAGEALARKFTPLVHRLVQNVLGPQRRQEWDDACQAIFLRLFSNLAKWEQRCPFCKWVAVVAARRAIDITRLPAPMEPLPAAELADPHTQPADPELLQRVEQAVAGFPPEWRELWQMWMQGVPREEMAQRLGKSVRTVQYWLAEMLDRLQERVGH